MVEVSVIVPTYNRLKKLPITINSILNQTFDDFEIIIVNDGEDEISVQKVISEFNDSRIHYLINQRKKGANGARNTGLEQAKGKFIAFLDDDDLWYPQKIQKQLQLFYQSQNKVGLVYSGFEIVSANDPQFSKKIFPQKKGKLLNDIIIGNFIGSPTPLIRRDILFDAGPFDESLKSSQDWDLWIRIAKITEFDFVNEILAKYTVHGDQISFDFEKKIQSFDHIIKKYSYLFNANKKAFATMNKKTAVLYLLNGKIKKCRKRLVRALVIDGLRLDLIVHLIFSFFPKIYRGYVNKYIMVKCGEIKLIY